MSGASGQNLVTLITAATSHAAKRDFAAAKACLDAIESQRLWQGGNRAILDAYRQLAAFDDCREVARRLVLAVEGRTAVCPNPTCGELAWLDPQAISMRAGPGSSTSSEPCLHCGADVRF
jgi:hypothetical protein